MTNCPPLTLPSEKARVYRPPVCLACDPSPTNTTKSCRHRGVAPRFCPDCWKTLSPYYKSLLWELEHSNTLTPHHVRVFLPPPYHPLHPGPSHTWSGYHTWLVSHKQRLAYLQTNPAFPLLLLEDPSLAPYLSQTL